MKTKLLIIGVILITIISYSFHLVSTNTELFRTQSEQEVSDEAMESYNQCLSDDVCRLKLYMTSQEIQKEIVMDYGNEDPSEIKYEDGSSVVWNRNKDNGYKDDSEVPSEQELLDNYLEEEILFNEDSFLYKTEIEALTHGDLSPDKLPIKWSQETLDYFEEQQQKPYMIELRTVFSKYLSGESLAEYDELLLVDSHEQGGLLYGLSSFDKTYFEGEFDVYAIYKHYLGGYDVFIIFDDRPDKLFRAWVDMTANEEGVPKWKLRMFHDTGIPEDEVRAVYEQLKIVDNNTS
jgi:hypothetical protein